MGQVGYKTELQHEQSYGSDQTIIKTELQQGQSYCPDKTILRQNCNRDTPMVQIGHIKTKLQQQHYNKTELQQGHNFMAG